MGPQSSEDYKSIYYYAKKYIKNISSIEIDFLLKRLIASKYYVMTREMFLDPIWQLHSIQNGVKWRLEWQGEALSWTQDFCSISGLSVRVSRPRAPHQPGLPVGKTASTHLYVPAREHPSSRLGGFRVTGSAGVSPTPPPSLQWVRTSTIVKPGAGMEMVRYHFISFLPLQALAGSETGFCRD